MRKIKIAALILIIIVGLIVLVLFNLNSLVNKNKDFLLSKVEESLGREVTAEGFELSLLDTGFKLKNFTVSDDAAFSEGAFVRAPYLQINLEFLPLLWKELRIEGLILNQPTVRVIRNEEGQFNFETLGAAEGEKKEEEKEEDAGLPIYASLIKINGGEIYYTDRKENVELRAGDLDFTAKNISLDKPIPVSLNAAVLAEQQNVSVSGRLGPLGDDPDFGKVPLEGNFDIDRLNVDALKKSLPFIKEYFPDRLNTDGPVSLSARVEKTQDDIVLKEGVLEATESTVSWGDDFHKPKGVPFVISTDARVAENAVNLENTEIKLATLVLNVDGEIGRGDALSINLAVGSNQAELSVLEQTLTALNRYDLSGKFRVNAKIRGEVGGGKSPQINGTLALSDATAQLPKISKPVRDLNATVQFTGEGATLQKTSFLLGDSKINLTAQVENFSPLLLTYNLTSPELKLADLKAVGPEDGSPGVFKKVESEGRIFKENGSLNTRGTVSSTQGAIYDLNYENLQAAFTLADKTLAVESLKLLALDGSLQGSGRYEFRESPARFTLSSEIRNVQLVEFFRSVLDTDPDNIRGKANIDVSLSGRGKKWEEIKPTLAGEGYAEVVDGALLNVNIAEKVLSGVTGIPGLTFFISPRIRSKYPEIFGAQDTVFEEFNFPFTLNDRKLQTDDLTITASDYTIDGEGWVGFDKRVDFGSVLVLSEELSQDIVQDGKAVEYILDEQGRLEIPFAVSGTLPDVNIRPDGSYLAQIIQRAAIRKGTEELKERVLDEILPPLEGTSEEEVKSPAAPKKEGIDLQEEVREGLKRFLK